MAEDGKPNPPLTEELLASRDTQDFVSLRRRIIAQVIDEKRFTAADLVGQLIELQHQLDQFRAVNVTPLKQMQHIVLLMEELVLQYENVARKFRERHDRSIL